MTRTTICPVTFLNDETKLDDNVNGLFTDPYHNFMLNDVLHAKMIDSIKQNYSSNDTDFKDFKQTYIYDRNIYLSTVISSYINMNSRELVKQVLLSYVSDLFGADLIREDKNREDFSSAVFNSSFLTYEMLEFIDKYEFVYLGSQDLSSTNIQFNFMMNNLRVDEIYSKAVEEILNKYITDYLNTMIICKILDDFYKMLYFKCFGKEFEGKLPDITTEYTFCGSIMREVLQSHLPVLYDGFVSIMMVASNMMSNKLDYIDHMDDKSYTSHDSMVNNAYLRDHVEEYSKLLDTRSDE